MGRQNSTLRLDRIEHNIHLFIIKPCFSRRKYHTTAPIFGKRRGMDIHRGLHNHFLFLILAVHPLDT